MKTVSAILKILAALAAIAGVIYAVATYGDKLVAWSRRVLGIPADDCCCDCDCDECDCDCDCDECDCEASAEEAPAEEDFEAE